MISITGIIINASPIAIAYSTNEMFYIYFFGGIALIIYLIEKKIKEIMGE